MKTEDRHADGAGGERDREQLGSVQFFSHHYARFVFQHNNGEEQIIIIVCYSGRLTRLLPLTMRPGSVTRRDTTGGQTGGQASSD